jgi:hypothetical protein
MTILDNLLLSALFLIINLAGLTIFILAERNKLSPFALYGLLTHAFICLLYFFVCYLNAGVFVLTKPQDFTTNLVYFISILGALVNAGFGLKIFYQHRLTPAMTIQLGIFFSAILVVTQLSNTGYQWYLTNKSAQKVKSSKGFNPTGDFNLQGSKNSKDSSAIK